MKRPAAAVALLALAGWAAGCAAPSGGGGAADVMPESVAAAGLERSGEAERFAGSELYSHIDGGAEVYLELGFDHLVVQEYVGGGAELAAELYVMRDSAAAAGVYLQSCGRETPGEDLADRNTVNDYQVQLLHGRNYLVVNDVAGTGNERAELVALAGAVADRLGPAAPFAGLDALPAADRVAGSERIARGPLGLQSIVTLGEGDMLQLGGRATAVAADYEPEGGARTTLLVVRYPSPEAAVAALAHAGDNLDSYHTVVSRTESRLVFSDAAGRFGELTVSGPLLTARLNLQEQPAER